MMEAQFAAPRDEGREDYTEILSHLAQQRICFVDEQGQEREFSQFPLLIGRGHDCGWVIQNKNISRHHAEITFAEEAYGVQDLRSLNGVRVNGFKIDRVVLEDGDQVSFGELRFTFQIRQAVESRAPYVAPSMNRVNDLPDFDQQEAGLQLDDLDLDDLYMPEAEAEQDLFTAPTAKSASKKWWPAILAILAAATLASALVAVAYYFLQPQLGTAQKPEVKSVEQAQVVEAPVSSMAQQPGAMAEPAVEHESAWQLGPASKKSAQPAMVPEAAMAPASVASATTALPLPRLAAAHLDLPAPVRNSLSQASKVSRTAEKKTSASMMVAGSANEMLQTTSLPKAIWRSYVAGNEGQLAPLLEQAAKKIQASGGRQKNLSKIQSTVSHLLDLYHQADKSYQAGDKAQAFTLWAQFLAQEKAWLGNQHSAYYRKVTQSVMNEYLSRAQAATAAGNPVLAEQYRKKAEALAPLTQMAAPPAEKKPASTTMPSVVVKKTAPVALNPTSSARAVSDAEVMYQKGLRLEYSDLDQSMALWRQVIQTAPADSEVYARAAAKLAWYDKWRATH